MDLKVKKFILCFSILSVTWFFCLPTELFDRENCSTIVTDRNGYLLGARIAADGQWRFPPAESVPHKFETALIEFEDRYFRFHPGVNPISLAKAAVRNITNGRVVSGGSTISMQVIRMSRKKDRTLWQKITEILLATRLEARFSKDEILSLYASNAPFGGNVVGIDAAAWRYFGKPADELSWAESATLAVLPNAPSMIHPGKNREALLKKRNRLLQRLHSRGFFDSDDLLLYCGEPLPDAPLPLPNLTPHLTDRYNIERKGEMIKTSIDKTLQENVMTIAGLWHEKFKKEGINDIAVVVADVRSGEFSAYCGNAGYGSSRQGADVDAASAPRSTGSILKPLLYYAMLSEGKILPKTLLRDTPVNLNGFSPQNFDRKFYGAVPADEALARSLNIPSVHLLREYGVAPFMEFLQKAGMTTLTRSASDYGLSLILGGAEGTLSEISLIYAGMSAAYQGLRENIFTDKTALWYTFEAIKEVNRPEEIDWKTIPSIQKIAWKTGTSFGFRDAWAIGITADYVVGVWAGNAQGQGCAGLTGARTAGPVMFDIFNILPYSEWFSTPVYGEYTTAEVCCKSGHLKGPYCETCDTVILPVNAFRTSSCPYHKVGGNFLLPPAMEWYYRQNHPEYISANDSNNKNANRDPLHSDNPLEFIYPENGAVIRIPKQLDGSRKGIVFSLAHRVASTTVFWHLDNSYIGKTEDIHSMTAMPDKGRHTMTATDRNGNTVSVCFTID